MKYLFVKAVVWMAIATFLYLTVLQVAANLNN